jgi:SAM-dependent methyltransferase
MEVPPIGFENCSFDSVVSFQVIEHIEDDMTFVREVARVLRPEGKFVVSTPNAPMSLTRNPWHVREYKADELRNLLSCHFSNVELYGVVGNEKIMEYYRKNRQSVRKITRFDILDLQHRLPRKLLQMPYNLLNRLNRRSLHKKNTSLTDSIVMEDYSIVPYEAGMECFDLFAVATK